MAPSDRPEPIFAAPWHAQAFALAVHLNEAGFFTWPEWVTRFSTGLAQAGLAQELDGGDDYFTVWLATLEGLMREQGHAGAEELAAMKEAWTRAYLATPHGTPVHLSAGEG